MSAWMKERVDRLLELLSEGYSSGRIAVELELTRNAVIGKARRLGLKLAAKPSHVVTPPPRPAWVQAIKKFTPSRAIETDEIGNRREEMRIVKDHEIPAAQRCGLFDLSSKTCRWPVGDPRARDFFFCGAKPVDGCVYCGPHTRRSLMAFSAVVANEKIGSP